MVLDPAACCSLSSSSAWPGPGAGHSAETAAACL